MNSVRFDAGICTDLDAALTREWLETNGIGGFSSSTIAGVNTRRYHGLLTAALHPPVSRYVLLSKVEETLIVGGQRFELSANLYPGVVYPRGFELLHEFRLDPFPVFTYFAGKVTVVKRVFMVHGENTVVLRYQVQGADGAADLELRPLIAFRDYHAVTHENTAISGILDEWPGGVAVQPYVGLPRLYFAHNGSGAVTGDWYRHFEYPREREHGLEFREDLFQPFMIRVGGNADLIVSLQRRHHEDAKALEAAEAGRKRSHGAGLQRAANQFLADHPPYGRTVIAGFHWFTDWGRDAMIALPGLTLTTGRFDEAERVLLAFSQAADRGMIPNRFADADGEPEYNTADASLWFFEAVAKYVAATGNIEFVRDRLYATLRSIIEWHVEGTRFGIHGAENGLLVAGDGRTQLTWMDARVAGIPVTPRAGKPVEVQALWYNALRIAEDLAGRFADPGWAARVRRIASTAYESFLGLFWNAGGNYLFDVVDGDSRDASIRPNQVIALSLRHPIVDDREKAQAILEVVQRELLTPFGLRTLSSADPRYRGTCVGTQEQRDSSYHQGTVWPWLLGPYTDACKRFGYSAPTLNALFAHTWQAGLGTVSEIFDGDAPHEPRGCIAQAWSVGELLRISRRDMDGHHASLPPADAPT